MTREPLDRLRRADPVPQPVAYSDDDQARSIAVILDRDGQRPVTLLGTTPRRQAGPRRLVTGVAAAVVLVLAVGSAVFVARRGGNDDAAGSGPVSCVVDASGGSRAVGARMAQAETVIGDRLRLLGGSAHAFTTDSTDGRIGFTPHGISVANAAQACRASAVDVRPVISRPAPLDTRAARSSTPLSTLTFALPSTEAAYARLTATQRGELAVAMSHYDCSPLPGRATAGLTCTTVTGVMPEVLLVGPPVVHGSDLDTATAESPSSGAVDDAWTVALSFDATGAARFQAFTAAHHTGDSTASLEACGTPGRPPCSDFLAITVNGEAESVPVTNAVLDSGVSISGRFTQATAQTLAADLTAAAVRLRAG